MSSAAFNTDKVTQYILTYGDTAGEEPQRLMSDMKRLAQLQNRQYQTLFESLRWRCNLEATEASEQANEALESFLSEFTSRHNLDLNKTTHYFGGRLYPDGEDSVAVYDADFSLADSWKNAATDPIGYIYKRARIIPTNLTTAEAFAFLRQTREVFEKQKCQPVIMQMEGSENVFKVNMQIIDGLNVPVITSSMENLMYYMLEGVDMEECLLPVTNAELSLSSQANYTLA